MKNYIFFFTFLTWFPVHGQTTSTEVKDNGWTKDNLKGNVKSYTQISFHGQEYFGEFKIDTNQTYYGNAIFVWDNHKRTYDENGNEIEYAVLNSKGEIKKSKCSKKYDEKEYLIESKCYNDYGDLSWFTYKRDENGNLIESCDYRSGGTVIWKTLYDESGNEIEVNYYDSDGSLTWKTIKDYNSSGNIIEANKYNSDGSLDVRTTYAYDENWNLIESGTFTEKTFYTYDEKGNRLETSIWSDGVTRLFLEYAYDENGRLIKGNTYSLEDGRLYYTCTYKYDENGNLIEENKDSDHNIIRYWRTYKYDENGNLIEYHDFYYDGSHRLAVTFKYEYDKSGNWTKRIKYTENTAQVISERVYEYYD